MSYDYSSTQVNLPNDLAKIVEKLTHELINKNDLYTDGGDTGLPDVSHVTVLYGIEDDLPSVELQDFIKHYPKFTITLGKISLFKNDECDVVKVEVISPDLHVLHNEFADIVPNTQTFPDYMPHVTMAYVNKGTYDHLENMNKLSGLSFLADSVIFSTRDEKHVPIALGKY